MNYLKVSVGITALFITVLFNNANGIPLSGLHNGRAPFLIQIIAMENLNKEEEKDAVEKAHISNHEKAMENKVDNDVSKFMVKSADARMMDREEGRLAAKKGTTPSIRQYGELMIKDQTNLLEEIKKISAHKNISLPESISAKKERGRKNLSEKEGQDFDKKFIKMITIDHKRDVRLFKKAIEFNDQEVGDFARTYLPMIQSHLDKINVIKEEYK